MNRLIAIRFCFLVILMTGSSTAQQQIKAEEKQPNKLESLLKQVKKLRTRVSDLNDALPGQPRIDTIITQTAKAPVIAKVKKLKKRTLKIKPVQLDTTGYVMTTSDSTIGPLTIHPVALERKNFFERIWSWISNLFKKHKKINHETCDPDTTAVADSCELQSN